MRRIVWMAAVAVVAGALAVCGGGSSGTPPLPASITGVDNWNPAPFSTLTINGFGFDPAHSAISVLVTPTGGAVPTVVPVSAATSTTLTITVPPLVDQASGGFTAGGVTLQVLQLNGSALATSNGFGSVSISALPGVPSGVSPGALTLAFLEEGQSVLQTVQASASASTRLAGLGTSAGALSTDLTGLAAAIHQIMSGTASVAVPTANGAPFTIDGRVLAASDQLVLGYVTQFTAGLRSGGYSAGTALSTASKLATAACVANTGDAATDALICQMTQYHQQLATTGASAVQLGAKIEMGAYLGLLGGWAADAFVAAGAVTAEVAQAAQLAWGVASSYVSAYATASQAPPLSESLQHVGADMLDRMALGGVGVLPAVLDAFGTYAEAAKLASGTSAAPQQGLILSASTSSSGAATAVAFTSSASTGAWLAIPDQQGVTPTASITLALDGGWVGFGGGTPDAGMDGGIPDAGTDGGTPDAGTDGGSLACCACSFDVSCTAFGAGGCWRCQNSTISGGVCQASSTALTSYGACVCDPTLYQVCQ